MDSGYLIVSASKDDCEIYPLVFKKSHVEIFTVIHSVPGDLRNSSLLISI